MRREDGAGCDGGMTAQGHLDARGPPTQTKDIGFVRRGDESGLGQVHLPSSGGSQNLSAERDAIQEDPLGNAEHLCIAELLRGFVPVLDDDGCKDEQRLYMSASARIYSHPNDD